MISASKMERWLECHASEKLIQIRKPDDEYSEMGRDHHEVLARRTLLGDFDEALGLDATKGAWTVENAVAWNPVMRTGRRLDTVDRQYPDPTVPMASEAFEIPGTYDGVFLSHDKKYAMILDHKTGFTDAQRADRNCQLLFFASWLHDVEGTSHFRLVLSYTRGEDPNEAEPTFEYADIGTAEIEAYRHRVKLAKEDAPAPTDTRPGPWCRRCDADLDCASRNGALKVIAGKFISGAVSIEDITLHWHQLLQVERVVSDAISQMKRLVIDEGKPVPLPGGRALVASTRRGPSKLNGDIAHHVLKELHGEDVAKAAVEVTTKVSRDSIKKALDLALSTESKAKMMKEIEEAVAGMGGVSRGDDVVVVKEVNEKEQGI